MSDDPSKWVWYTECSWCKTGQSSKTIHVIPLRHPMRYPKTFEPMTELYLCDKCVGKDKK